jgi:cell division protein FtsB
MAGTGPAKRAGGRRPGLRIAGGRLTGRAGILALALCAVMVTIAYPLQEYLTQRSQINALDSHNDATAQQVAQLQAELAKWADPAYVAIQARVRLHYVKPGEIGFIVPNPSAGSEPLGIPTPASTQPWYDRLWSSVTSPSATPAPTPTR